MRTADSSTVPSTARSTSTPSVPHSARAPAARTTATATGARSASRPSRGTPSPGTSDGNEVRITAVIENRSSRALTVPVVLRDKVSGRTLEGPGLENPRTLTFPAGGSTTFEVVWRTDGFAWESGKAASARDIQLL